MNPEILRGVAAPFFAQDTSRPLFVSVCCQRMFVGWDPPTKCRTCPRIPSPIELKSMEDIEAVAAKILP